MTSSDAPRPPGGPLRQDGADGDFAPDEERTDAGPAERDESPNAAGGDGVPPVTHDRPEQSGAAAAEQEENAETSQDQPSS